MFSWLSRFSIFLSLFVLFAGAGEIVGKLHKSDSGYQVHSQDGVALILQIDKKYHVDLPTLTKEFFDSLRFGHDDQGVAHQYPDFFLSFKGERTADGFYAFETPMIMSGTDELVGLLEKRDGNYFIAGRAVVFEKAVPVNGQAFNTDSINHFIGKSVKALALNRGAEKVVTAIVNRDLYSAKVIESVAPRSSMEGMATADMDTKIDNYVLDLVYRNEVSQSQNSFRQMIYQRDGYRPQPGDLGLIITMSGRQGDDTGALGGHFAFGRVKVKANYDLDMEIWNYYPVPNEKKIMSGHNHYVDYFGNLTAGQNNYRPTYSYILYGVSAEKLQKMRDTVGRDFTHMREQDKDFGVYYSCTTTSTKGLRKSGFRAKKRANPLLLSGMNILGAATSVLGMLYPGIPKAFGLSSSAWDLKKSLDYLLLNDPSRYLPLAAFDGYLKKLPRLIKRFDLNYVDYIFHAQTPSGRNVGGATTNNLGAIKKGKDLYEESIDPSNPWSDEEIAVEIQRLFAK